MCLLQRNFHLHHIFSNSRIKLTCSRTSQGTHGLISLLHYGVKCARPFLLFPPQKKVRRRLYVQESPAGLKLHLGTLLNVGYFIKHPSLVVLIC